MRRCRRFCNLISISAIAPQTIYRTNQSKFFARGFNEIVEQDDLDHILFKENGHWVKELVPAYWSTPEDQLHSDAFFIVVDVCVNDLPAKIARVFSMKEFLECDVAEICSTLKLSQSDYWQCMSRARKRLQICLNTRWFEKEQ